MQTAKSTPSVTDAKYREQSFVFSPSWGFNFHFRADGVAISFDCRDHGDREPVDSVDDLDVSFAEFCRCLNQAVTEGKAESGHLRITRHGDNSDSSYRFGYYNHFYGREHNLTVDCKTMFNLLNMAGLLSNSKS